jgi:DNA-binding NarL/FixJ family response regulator
MIRTDAMADTGAPIEVELVEDDRRAREGLQHLIDGSQGFRCSRAYGSLEAALAAADAPAPDVILLDVHLPGREGPDGVGDLLAKHPCAVIVMLTVLDEEERIFTSICNGASGYLLKKTPPVRLLEALREARQGGAPMSPEIALKVVQLFRAHRPAPAAEHDLSPQEVRLLSLLADGHSYLSAAGQLDVTINTVRNYVRRIYEKLHVHSKSEAVSKALKKRII